MLGSVDWTTWLGGLTVLIFSLLAFLLARFEKQMVRVFAPLDEGEEPAVSAYAAATNQAAQRLGYQFCGTRKQAKGGSYRIFGSLWLSPLHEVLAVVSWGKLGGLRFRKTVLYSCTGEGSYLASLDVLVEIFPTDAIEIETRLNADLFELLDLHNQRISRLAEGVVAFSPEDPWDEYDQMNACLVRNLVQAGKAVFIDSVETQWRYTLKGACLFAWRGWTAGLRAKKQFFKRRSIRRPGEAGYVEWPVRTGSPGAPSLTSGGYGIIPADQQVCPAGQGVAGPDAERAVQDEGAAAIQPPLAWPADPPEHSRRGLVSFVLALAAAVLLGYATWCSVTHPFDIDSDPCLTPFSYACMSAIAGVILAIAGLTQRHRKRLFAVLGLILNVMFLLLLVAVLVLLALALGA
ncbi:MAG: hypothetical protein ACYSUQ_02325 [Planctomycetota bacterium]|jgi:hypothetical protein